MQIAFEMYGRGVGGPSRVLDLARASGVSPRTVYRAFRRLYGEPPARLQRRDRLESARARLEAGRPGDSVTSVALDLGFEHLGRFAGHYRRLFGEPPSATLRRARSGRATSTNH
jgi:transcriptional regulator GlxA family with amidase domain